MHKIRLPTLSISLHLSCVILRLFRPLARFRDGDNRPLRNYYAASNGRLARTATTAFSIKGLQSRQHCSRCNDFASIVSLQSTTAIKQPAAACCCCFFLGVFSCRPRSSIPLAVDVRQSCGHSKIRRTLLNGDAPYRTYWQTPSHEE